MNKQLEDFARATLKRNLAMLEPANHRIFKLMYARDDGKSVAEAEAMHIDEVVDEMAAEKLDWAMTQVDNSLKSKAGALAAKRANCAHDWKDTSEFFDGEYTYECRSCGTTQKVY